MIRVFGCMLLLWIVAASASAQVALDERWADQLVGATADQLTGWKIAYGKADAATIHEADGARTLTFKARSPNTAIAATHYLKLGEDGSISVSAVMRDLPESAGPAGVMLRGYDDKVKRIDSYWFLFDPGRKSIIIKRGNAVLGSADLPDIRKMLDDATWSPGQSSNYQLDVKFAGDHAALSLSINGKPVSTIDDSQPPQRFASVEVLLFAFNGNDVAFGPVSTSTPTIAAPSSSPAGPSSLLANTIMATALAADVSADEERRTLAEKNRKQFAGHGERLTMADIHASAGQVAQYERFEVSFTLTGPYANPFDVDDVRVDAQITRPDGKIITVPAFFMQPYESQDGRTRIEAKAPYKAGGEAGWRLRYAPTQPGRHQVVLIATLPGKKQQTQSEPVIFDAAASGRPGYVRISKTNPLYFENSADASLFYPVGVNVPWARTYKRSPYTGKPENDYEYYFGKAANQMTATRVWQCHYAWLEWMPVPGEPADSSWSGYAGLNYYNQMVASAFDRVFELAEQNHLRIMLVLEDNDEQDTEDKPAVQHVWGKNPYNVINGGPCKKPEDVFTSPLAAKAYRNRLRYIMARWGYSTSLWSLNSWNDRTGVPDYVLPWLHAMHDYLHQLADDWRPMIYGTNFRFEAQAISDYAQAEKSRLIPGKPNVIQEAYFTRDKQWFIDTLQLQLWSNLGRGCGGVMVWPHPLVDATDSWSVFKSAADFLKDMPLNRQMFKPIDARVISAQAGNDAPMMRVIAMAPYGDIPMWGVKATAERFEIDPNKGSQFLEGFARKLYGERADRRAWRTTPTFIFDTPADGEMIVEVAEMTGDDMRIVATDKGQVIKDIPLTGHGRRGPVPGEHYLRIPLAAGSHQLTLALNGPQSDWLQLHRILLTYHETQPSHILDVDGLSSDDHAFLYIRNVTGGELPQKVLGQLLVPVENVKIIVHGLKSGRYDVVLFDVEKGADIGREQMSANENGLLVTLPRIDRQLAIKVIPNGL